MSRPIRLDDGLVADAEAEARHQKRSLPKQLEYWAELGRSLERKVNRGRLLAILRELSEAEEEARPSGPLDPDEIFRKVAADRKSGELAEKVTRARFVYETSLSHPGLLDRIDDAGRRVTGSFRDGAFVPRSDGPESSPKTP